MKELNDPVLLHTWIEKIDRNWLKKEAKKKKLSIAKLIRNWIAYFKNAKEKESRHS